MTHVQNSDKDNFYRIKLPLKITLLVAMALILPACSEEQEPQIRKVVRPVKLLKILSGAEAQQRSYPGRVRAAKRVDLAFQVGGPLIELAVDESQEVDRGHLLARIDPRDFENNLRSAKGQLAKAYAALRSARSEYNRIQRIRSADPGAASESMVVKRREAVDRTSADIASLKAAADSAQNSLGDTYLRAPFKGIISKRYVDNFQEVRPKQKIISLDDISRLEIIVDIPEITMARIREDRALKIFADFAVAPGKRYPLVAKEYATRADPATQTYQVVLEMERPKDLNVLPGMTATVSGSSATQETSPKKFIVPAYAIFADDAGKPHLWVLDPAGMTVHKRSVQPGELVGKDSIEINAGLTSGETIAVTGVTLLGEGMKVRDLAQIEGYGE